MSTENSERTCAGRQAHTAGSAVGVRAERVPGTDQNPSSRETRRHVSLPKASQLKPLTNASQGSSPPHGQASPQLPACFHSTAAPAADGAGALTLDVMWKDLCPPTAICFFITLKRLNRHSRRPALCTRRLKSTSSHMNLLRSRRGGR